MRNHIIFFSGGKASFAVAWWVKKTYPKDNIVLYFTDTLFEDEDLYRFNYEVSDKLELPLLIHADGRSPLDLMKNGNFIYNSRIARCSIDLKVNVAKKFIKKGIKPNYEEWHNKQYLKQENFTKEPILYFGIGFDEAHRQVAIKKNWQPYQIEMPLIEKNIDVNKAFNEYNIKQPRLYDIGFAHNNCKGRCVKGGQGHWLQLLQKDYISFCEMRDFEIMMNEIINAKNGTKGKKYSYMKKNNESYMLIDLENDYKSRPQQLDIFDFGTCGCFVDE